MAAINVRNYPDELHRLLKKAAIDHQRTVPEEVIAAITHWLECPKGGKK